MLDRKTEVSRCVILELEKAASPLSAGEILRRLESHNLSPNKTTVYRILKKLSEKKAVSEIAVRHGAVYYELTKHSHHHFICTACGDVSCLQATLGEHLNRTVTDLLPSNKFEVESHEFNIYGRCEPCVKESKGI
jgi:Fe2+ or Zn2+ uptake regulation protein